MKRKLINKLWRDRRSQKLSKDTPRHYKPILNHSNYRVLDYRKSPIFKLLSEYSVNTMPITIEKKSTLRFLVPERFSLIEDANNVLFHLKSFIISYMCSHAFAEKIVIDYRKCKYVDLSASTLLDIILMEIKKLCIDRITIAACCLRDNKQVHEMILISGIIRHLDLRLEDEEGRKTAEDENIKKSNDNNLQLIYKPNNRVASQRIVEYIDSQLNINGNVITREGKNRLCQMIGEVVDNCEVHSGCTQEWFVIGHCYQVVDNQDCNRCQITILDFGDSFFQSILNTKLKGNNRQIEKLNRIHSRHGFNENWTIEELYTLCALQEGVSRLKSKEEPDRGTGTITLIECLQELGKSTSGDIPTMTIVSGNSEIRFDKTYQLRKYYQKNGDLRHLLAFNERNSLKEPPNEKNVRHLKNGIPGTIISMDFLIDKKFIEQQPKEIIWKQLT